jgi:hypothetical protein
MTPQSDPKVKNRLQIHPFLFAASPVLTLYADNAGGLRPSQLILPICLVLVFALAFRRLFGRIVRDTAKAAILLSVWLISFMSIGRALHPTRQVTLAGASLAADWFVIFAWLAAFSAVLCLMLHSRARMDMVTTWMNLTAVILLIVPAARIGLAEYRSLDSRASALPTVRLEAQQPAPHIIYIVLDGYGRSDVLKDIYRFDNEEFLSRLRQRGFYVADESRSNYSQTLPSLAASLNFAYVQGLSARLGPKSEDRTPLIRRIEDSRLARSLRRAGYRVVAFASGFPSTEIREADVFLEPKFCPDEFFCAVLDLTPVPRILSIAPIRNSLQHDWHRRRLLYIFDRLPAVVKFNQPTFVFAHVLAPHPPFVFGANGEPVNPNRNFSIWDGSHFYAFGTQGEYVEGYARQIAFINRKIEQTVDNIIERSKRPVIVILQADHGPGSRLDQRDPRKTDVRERLGILNAYYFPDREYGRLYQGVTPVNTFRIVLNQYFGADMRLLEDKSYIAPMPRPYQLTDVTAKLAAGKPPANSASPKVLVR